MKSVSKFYSRNNELCELNGSLVLSFTPLDVSKILLLAKLENGRSITVYSDELFVYFMSDDGDCFHSMEEAITRDRFNGIETDDIGLPPCYADINSDFHWYRPKNDEEIEAIRRYFKADFIDFEIVKPNEWVCVETSGKELIRVHPMSTIMFRIENLLKHFERNSHKS